MSVARHRVQAATILRSGQLWQLKRSLLGLVSFQIFYPSPCTICFVQPMMDLGLRSRVFLLLGLPIVRSTLLGVIFCLDFNPFFFFSCSLAGCFSFIYLFINLFWTCALPWLVWCMNATALYWVLFSFLFFFQISIPAWSCNWVILHTSGFVQF